LSGSTRPEPTAIPPVSLKDYGPDFTGFSRRLGESFERYGFAVVADHDLPADLVEGCLARTKAFFALPEAVKRRYKIEGGAGQRGYTPFGVETAKGAARHDLKAFWHVGRDLPPDHRYRGLIEDNVWPGEIEGFRAYASGLYDGLDALGLKLLRAIARHLGLNDDFFAPTVRDSDSILRLLHYPPLTAAVAADADADSLRAGPHEDINAITLLLGAEEAGLELLDRDGRWLAINPPPGSVVVNIGDMLQRLTNHALPSTTHRVVNPEPRRRGIARYSMPFFLHFAPDYRIETLPGCIGPDRPDRYPQAITSRDYLLQRLREIKLG
jgi:isopenicillin N synthase-like dioxygenase